MGRQNALRLCPNKVVLGNSADSLPGVASLGEIMNTTMKLTSRMIALLVPLILLVP